MPITYYLAKSLSLTFESIYIIKIEQILPSLPSIRSLLHGLHRVKVWRTINTPDLGFALEAAITLFLWNTDPSHVQTELFVTAQEQDVVGCSTRDSTKDI
jgi:hypothetical protein